MIRVVVQAAPIALTDELERMEVTGAGGVATFTGLVRADDGVEALELEHYAGVTERALEDIATAAADRWMLQAVTIVHRVGVMRPGERIVFVAAAAPHRQAALEACACMIDRLKTDAPFWKRETRDSKSTWVEARASDDEAAGRWNPPPANGRGA